LDKEKGKIKREKEVKGNRNQNIKINLCLNLGTFYPMDRRFFNEFDYERKKIIKEIYLVNF
jgi:hypothetical protein